ncbi:ABC transporter permease [Mycolicibacterium smegmatis]|uniref:ABC transporter permease protein n=3 Tax=Mycolicibacterium smegmatis TaxID=1772 RepID=A0QRE4_MYCS2|nr:ABC transporter permease [Mycolicibacterium smegmatis]ABK73087.1 ABC transporter permease protein [Mycolicibacterium smegmatis MC2 155]AFP37533.1 ABC-type oligopeptide transport systems, permease component [Mycolicibacterium smegmatis MC2 155]AIU06335.1 ABC transporter permease [Mycolicibacterium smegmatis MC2 155]AIU12960.1 ABC transporter permease [Mycolicibacterium smegmatis]AIU19584.1 ABC transporter permease [Mycolicibacterium smegmatis]
MSTLVAGRTFPWVRRSSAGGPVQVDTDTPKPQWRLAVRAFSRDRMAVVSLVVLVIVTLAAVFAPLLTPYSPTAGDPVDRLAGIGTEGHLLGLDGQGRDIWTRLLYGGRNSLMTAVVPVFVVFPLALMIGLFAGYRRSRAGEVLMRILDVLFAFPLVLLAIALSAVLGAGLGNVMLAIGITLIPYMARVAYTATVSEASKDYIEAARAYGANPLLLMFRELMPNVVVQLLVYSTTLCGLMIVVASGLSFLGVGVIPPTPDWGIMTADGKNVLLEGIYHVATIPGLLILVVSLAFNLVGDGIRDALDPRKQTN